MYAQIGIANCDRYLCLSTPASIGSILTINNTAPGMVRFILCNFNSKKSHGALETAILGMNYPDQAMSSIGALGAVLLTASMPLSRPCVVL